MLKSVPVADFLLLSSQLRVKMREYIEQQKDLNGIVGLLRRHAPLDENKQKKSVQIPVNSSKGASQKVKRVK